MTDDWKGVERLDENTWVIYFDKIIEENEARLVELKAALIVEEELERNNWYMRPPEDNNDSRNT